MIVQEMTIIQELMNQEAIFMMVTNWKIYTIENLFLLTYQSEIS